MGRRCAGCGWGFDECTFGEEGVELGGGGGRVRVGFVGIVDGGGGGGGGRGSRGGEEGVELVVGGVGVPFVVGDEEAFVLEGFGC